MIKLKESNKILQDKRENGLKEIESLKAQLRSSISSSKQSSRQQSPTSRPPRLPAPQPSISLTRIGSSDNSEMNTSHEQKKKMTKIIHPKQAVNDLKKVCEATYKEFLQCIPFDDPNSKLIEKMIGIEKKINDIVMKLQEISEGMHY